MVKFILKKFHFYRQKGMFSFIPTCLLNPLVPATHFSKHYDKLFSLQIAPIKDY